MASNDDDEKLRFNLPMAHRHILQIAYSGAYCIRTNSIKNGAEIRQKDSAIRVQSLSAQRHFSRPSAECSAIHALNKPNGLSRLISRSYSA
jgi:hypothetical protein